MGLAKENKGKSGDIATLNESGAITSVAFDYGNKYVSATSGDIVKVWEFKKWIQQYSSTPMEKISKFLMQHFHTILRIWL